MTAMNASNAKDIAGGILIHVGGGVHVVAVLVGGEPGTKPDKFLIEQTEAVGVVEDEAEQEDHDQVLAMAQEWLQDHARLAVANGKGFQLGDYLVSQHKIYEGDFKARWVVRDGEVTRHIAPVSAADASLAAVTVVPAVAPGGSGESADLAMFCGTIASSLGLDVAMAITGDITQSGKVLATGALPEKIRTALVCDVSHMLIPAAHGHAPGRRSGIQLWCAWTAHEGACVMLDAAADEAPVLEYSSSGDTILTWVAACVGVAAFLSWLIR
jgi:hypothetical protein